MHEMTQYKPSVVTLTTNPMLRDKVHKTVLAHRGRSIVVSNAHDFRIAIDGYYPILILVDLTVVQNVDTEKDTQYEYNREIYLDLIRHCKLLPHTRAITIVAIDDVAVIDDETTQQSAYQAGADLTLNQKALWSQLSPIIDQQINPPIHYIEGWDDALPANARKGLEEFNRGEYFEQHESLEMAWIAETRAIREMYQGILQTGVALLQIERNNWAGAIKLFRRGLPKLRTLPPTCQGINLAKFRRQMEEVHGEISQLGPKNLGDFDQSRFPILEFE